MRDPKEDAGRFFAIFAYIIFPFALLCVIDIVDDRMKSPETVDVKYRLHIIDSNAYHFVSPGYGYDVIHEDQLNHAVKVFESATKDRDYIGMAFFHIPLFEYEEMRTLYNNAADKSALGQGEFREGIHAPFENNGSFDKLYSANIVSYFCGHDHINYGDFLYTGTAQHLFWSFIGSFQAPI